MIPEPNIARFPAAPRSASQVLREIRVAIFPAVRRAQARWRLRGRASKWAPRAYWLALLGFYLACQAALSGHSTLGIGIASFFAGMIAMCAILVVEDEPEAGRVIGRGER